MIEVMKNEDDSTKEKRSKEMNVKNALGGIEDEISDQEEKTEESNEDNRLQEKNLSGSESPSAAVSQAIERIQSPIVTEGISSQRVFKKTSPNNKLTIYLNTRDLAVSDREMDRLQGIVVIDPDYLAEKKVFGQITLTFRYGREDEEVMGLKFCNEAVMTLAQLYPPHERASIEPPSLLQEALMKRIGPHAHPFTLTLAHVAPPSVQLVPAKEYNGAPIGTNYDIRVYAAERPDEKLHRRSTIKMGIRVIQKAPYSNIGDNPSVVSSLVSTGSRKPSITIESTSPSEPPHAAVDKPFLLSEGKVELEASLDKATYHQGEPVFVTVIVRNNSGKTVRRLKVFIVQHVDVCMFSNGKFKNVVAMLNCKDNVPVSPWSSLNHTFQLNPAKGTTKNWIALEDSFNRSEASLASTVTPPPSNPHDRNVFAIYVSYYVKVKILVGAMGGELSLKLPFTLTHAPERDHEGDPTSIHTKDMGPIRDPTTESGTPGTAQVELHQPRPSKPVCSFSIKKSPPLKYEDDILPCPDGEVT